MFKAQTNQQYQFSYSTIPQNNIFRNTISIHQNQMYSNDNNYNIQLSPNQLKENLKMVNSPDLKINYEQISSSPFKPKNFKLFQHYNQCSFEDLKTNASNSNESLLSNSNSQLTFNLRKSYENIQSSNLI